MALQNIGASNRDDAFYRYKMPKMVTKIEGRGNGIKTNVVNMVDIAKALGRPASYTTKYFGCELGAQSKFDEKTGTSLVNGAHDTAKLAGLLENFIKKYVQCYGCGNPETEILITKTQMLQLKCAACGFISDVDMRDKLTSFILKNPPEQKKSSKDKKSLRRAEKERLKEGEAADEEMKKLKKETNKKKPTSGAPTKDKASKKKGQTHTSDEDRSPPCNQAVDELKQAGSDDDDGDDIQWQTDTSREAAEQRMKEQLSAVTAEMVMLSTDEDKKKTAAEKKLPQKDKLVNEIKELLNNGSTPTQLKSALASLTASPQERMDALFLALFEGIGKGFAKEVAKKKKYILASMMEEETETSQKVLLEALEKFCGKASEEAVKEVALVLKGLYDDDVLEEEVILDWYKKGISGGKSSEAVAMWKKVKPFVEWLLDAESESETEE
ncbi:PREDICTED: probable eukaryotic translation initiation factor 5-1 [Tarenaya hassleriana]|uniref:probable eukaryotic translation initiation factor 5-1 n=1 Tax=Tarenaya hassleriana TaxID=28532 RepID=UPI00053C24D1|nr:PREDICTED: probable eukaryotic translation initiation factor 5-1 [Tarenaya hassleriana]